MEFDGKVRRGGDWSINAEKPERMKRKVAINIEE